MISHLSGALILVAALSSAAHAQGAQDAEALIEQGKRLRSAGDDAAAYDFYLRAYGIAPTPRAAGQLALCEYELNRWVDSEVHLQEALRAGEDPWVKRNRDVLVDMTSKVRLKLGRLEVTGRPEGADVEVAGRAVGRLPLPGPLRVPAGEVFVRVAASGFRTVRRTVAVPAKELQRVTVELEPGSDESPAAVLVTPDLRASGLGPSAPTADVSGQGAAPRSWQRLAGWIGAGTAGALAAGGGAGLLVRHLKTSQFNDYVSPQKTQCNIAFPQMGGGPCPGYLLAADRAKTIAIASFAGAGLFAVVSGLLLVTSPSASADLAAHTSSLTWRF